MASVEPIPALAAGVPHPLLGIAAGVAMYVAAVLVMRPLWRKAVARGAPIVHLFVADTKEERAWWLAVSLLAGIGEEITWRGVQAGLLQTVVWAWRCGIQVSGSTPSFR